MQSILEEEGYPVDLKRTYLGMVRKSVGTEMFQNLWILNPENEDIINNGDLACAYYVSGLLTFLGMIKDGVHTTVNETIQDLEESGWEKIEELEKGCIIVWAEKLSDSDKLMHRHIGFYVDNDLAISNQASAKSPQEHHVTFGVNGSPKYRRIEALYRWKNFDVYRAQ